MEIVFFEFLSGVVLKNNSSFSQGRGPSLRGASQKGHPLTQKSSVGHGAEPCVIWSPTQVTNSPLQSACENKAGRQWGSNQSCAVTLSGMLMSLQVTGGQWAPHGPTPSPLAPCVSFSLHTHKETPLARGHISNVLPSKRTGSPFTNMFVLCNVCLCPQITRISTSPGMSDVWPHFSMYSATPLICQYYYDTYKEWLNPSTGWTLMSSLVRVQTVIRC